MNKRYCLSCGSQFNKKSHCICCDIQRGNKCTCGFEDSKWEEELKGLEMIIENGKMKRCFVYHEEIKSFISSLLKKERELCQKIPHDTHTGWCCACDYDMSIFEKKLKQERKKVLEEIGMRKPHTKSQRYKDGYLNGWLDAMAKLRKDKNIISKL